MQTIQSQVNPRLLSKADRLFTGTLDGRIIEILQNTRRAGATEISITNHEGLVTVCDNGRGIDDFAQLLDLGSSGWDDSMEQAEDPAGVGIFCLAPREVRIASDNQSVVISERGWIGDPVAVEISEGIVQGTLIQFTDEPWKIEVVEKHAVFSGLVVRVDGELCQRAVFVSAQAVSHSDLGCRIEIKPRNELSTWHCRWKRNYYSDDVLVNFHGQVVQFTFRPISEQLQFLVDMTGEPTDIRMLLPARTQIVENEAFEELKDILEKEVYRYIQKRGSHKLKYSEYCRAKELGIDLPEATPTFNVGLLYEEGVEPIEVTKPDDFYLSNCYRMGKKCEGEFDEANVHLLAALGKFQSPFIPVEISPNFDGYSWADLPTVDRVDICVGKEKLSQYVWGERLTAVDSLEITAHTSDGRIFSHGVPMAVRDPIPRGDKSGWGSVEVLVTPEARDRLNVSDIWYHLGGFVDDSDTYDTQLYNFEEQLDLFWSTLIGPGEFLRTRLIDCLRHFELEWQTVLLDSKGNVTVTHQDGQQEVFAQQT